MSHPTEPRLPPLPPINITAAGGKVLPPQTPGTLCASSLFGSQGQQLLLRERCTHRKLQVLVSQNQDFEKDMWSVTVMEMAYERKPLLSLEMGQLWKEAKNPKRQSKGQVGNINFFMVHLHTMHSFCTCSVLLLRAVHPVFLCHFVSLQS